MSQPAAPQDAFVDLHMHSTASDGSIAPADVVSVAKGAGLAAIALTDHDTIDGLDEAHAAGVRLGVRIVNGVELSAMEDDVEVHVLGLHLERLDLLEQPLASFRGGRRVRAERIVERLNAAGVPMELEAVLAQADGGAIGRPHVARALIAGGWARDARDAFDRYLGAGRVAYVPKPHLGLADAVDLVHRAGGIAVMAHPGPDATRERVEQLAALGMDGVEVRHPSHKADDIARIGALVDHYRMVPSGGSDWHGAMTGPRTMGNQRVPAEWLRRQDTRVRERADRVRVA